MGRRKRRSDSGDEDTRPRMDVVVVDDWSGDAAARLATQIAALAGEEARTPDGGRALLAAVDAYHARHRGSLLVVLDQFEEHIRLHPSGHGFDDALAELVGDPRATVRVLIAIREDRLADLDRFTGRIARVLGNVLRLGPLSPQAALEAITRPIEHFAASTGRDVALEPGLAETVRDGLVALSERRSSTRGPAAAGERAAGEPAVDSSYLQLVMRRLWDEEIGAGGGTVIRACALARLGGVDEIVATHLDGALDRLPDTEQALAAAMLRYLVTPSGATACLTARDLADYTGRPHAEVEALAEKLSRPPARILRGVPAAGGAARGGGGGYELAPVLAEPAAEWSARRRTRSLERRARVLLLGLVAMTAIALSLVGYALDPGPMRRLELASVDARFDVRGAREPDSRIAVVTRASSPRNARARMARALRSIATVDPRAVALNISYLGVATSARNDAPRAADRALIRAVHGPLRERLVISTDQIPDEEGKLELFGRPDQRFGARTAPAVAWDGLPLDRGRSVRRITPAVRFEPEGSLERLAVVAARLAGGPRSLPGRAWIGYRGERGTFPAVALDDVVAGKPQALAKLRGKVVLVGYTAPPTFRTSAPGASVMDRTEIQANAISAALDGFPLRDAGGLVDVVLVVLLGLVPLGLALRLRPALVVALCLAAGVAFCVAAQLAFAAGRVVAVVSPLSSLVLATIAVTAVLVLRGRGGRADGPAAAIVRPR